MNFTSVFLKMVELFAIIIIGYIANKVKVIDKQARINLSKLVLNVTLPATILTSVLTQDDLPDAKSILSLILVATFSYVIFFLFAFIIPPILRVPLESKGIYQFMLTFGNVGFIGYPVTEAIFGSQAIFYTSIFNLPFNIIVYSVGVAYLTKYQKAKSTEVKAQNSMDDGNATKCSASKVVKTLVSPCMITSILAIILALIGVDAPQIFGNTCTIIGNITTPIALMIIGSSLADMPILKMFCNFRIYLYTIVKLIIIPLVTYFIFGLFINNQLLLGVSVIIAGMPVATNGTMLCLQYHADEELMAQGTFLTTIFSILTIPLLALLFI